MAHGHLEHEPIGFWRGWGGRREEWRLRIGRVQLHLLAGSVTGSSDAGVKKIVFFVKEGLACGHCQSVGEAIAKV
jgi:hypothetical protein